MSALYFLILIAVLAVIAIVLDRVIVSLGPPPAVLAVVRAVMALVILLAALNAIGLGVPMLKVG